MRCRPISGLAGHKGSTGWLSRSLEDPGSCWWGGQSVTTGCGCRRSGRKLKGLEAVGEGQAGFGDVVLGLVLAADQDLKPGWWIARCGAGCGAPGDSVLKCCLERGHMEWLFMGNIDEGRQEMGFWLELGSETAHLLIEESDEFKLTIGLCGCSSAYCTVSTWWY